MFCEKGVLRNFAKFKGKHLCQSLRPATLLKKRLWHRSFPVNFAEFQRTPFFIEHLRWLLLHLLKVLFFARRAGINKWGKLHFFFTLWVFCVCLRNITLCSFQFFVVFYYPTSFPGPRKSKLILLILKISKHGGSRRWLKIFIWKLIYPFP